ncbi:Hypothetical protein MexAM1_META2p0004 (plasmid) [Methylorubrum extorquens AM1]|uniref:Uncharacterized protein n=2 Tax=Methylorubrum extorquens TaxID=408 RepID=C5B3B5_METEA|nr:Hypothetical protein MexAM1_META2p0004 [Methylorubrum extorquens AM1]OAH40907.1 hypothetical protein AX289_28185 [Methylorubrum populi]
MARISKMRTAVLATLLLAATSSAAKDEVPKGGKPFLKNGVSNCVVPGTEIDFHLTGQGTAQVVKASSNYPPLLRAAGVKIWKAWEVNRDGLRLLVLDNGRATRIMVKLPAGNGMAFIGEKEGGVSDILCQVLVSP